jgi:hypothetical protein
LKKNCLHMMPNASCISNQPLSAAQRTAVLAAFNRSDASFCPGDRLVVAGLPAAPHLQVAPKSMTHKARAHLLHELKDLPIALGVPEQIEVVCPQP